MSLTDLDVSEGVGLFTDGSAYYRDGTGGWAWIAIDAFVDEAVGCGSASDTTNNRMEMTAWIKGLTALHDALGPCVVVVYSDSEYVGLGAMDRERHRKKNRDLWELLDNIIDKHAYVEFSHVKGHRDSYYNNRADELAGDARKRQINL